MRRKSSSKIAVIIAIVFAFFVSLSSSVGGAVSSPGRSSAQPGSGLSAPTAGLPRVFCMDPSRLALVKSRLAGGDTSLQSALKRLRERGDSSLKEGPFSVMDKTSIPPSGDKHDYMSRGPYWWPDPNKPDGLPYIRRDGYRNPEVRANAFDRTAIGSMFGAVSTLALAYYFTDYEPYAEHASELLRIWFLDPKTKMNPNLQYAQAIPGVVEGRGIGIIDTAGLTGMIDSIGLIERSKAWTDADDKAMRAWCWAYLEWLRTSGNGRDEDKAENNHGTYYDAQRVSLALYTGRAELARDILKSVPARRIDIQITPDGRQPLELARANSFGYSVMNLNGHVNLAQMAQSLGIDLWNYESRDGRSLRKAIDYLAQYADPEKEWPHSQIGRASTSQLLPLLHRAAIAYNDDRYEALIKKASPERAADSGMQFVWPR